ncbi:MAG: hypothetical protein J0M03_17670 [Acidobacteria bacterium]|nr:hypothetical protein [Acidobacteriota bacterium]
MKKLQKLLVLSACIVFFAITFYIPITSVASADNKKNCDPLTANPTVVLTSPNSANGEGVFQIGRRSYQVKYTVTIGTLTPQPNGNVTGLSSHVFDFYQNRKLIGSINTTDTNTLIPTQTPGLFQLQTTLTIVSGTKRFKNSCGELSANAMVDFVNGTATSMLSGSVCDCPGNGNNDDDD